MSSSNRKLYTKARNPIRISSYPDKHKPAMRIIDVPSDIVGWIMGRVSQLMSTILVSQNPPPRLPAPLMTRGFVDVYLGTKFMKRMRIRVTICLVGEEWGFLTSQEGLCDKPMSHILE